MCAYYEGALYGMYRETEDSTIFFLHTILQSHFVCQVPPSDAICFHVYTCIIEDAV